MSPMMVCAIGKMPPPPMPCSARAKISAGMLGASAQATEPTMKMQIAISIIRRRPWMSESLPNSGTAAVLASRYAVTTQLKFPTSPSVRPMVGRAGATMVCSSAERNIASMMPIMMAWMVARGSGVGADAGSGVAFIGPHHDGRRGKYNWLRRMIDPCWALSAARPRESGDPALCKDWIPASAGMSGVHCAV